MHPLATLIAVILTGLRAAIAASAALRFRDPALADCSAIRTALLCRAWYYIARTTARLERLIALWHAGALPQPRAPRATPPATPSPGATTAPKPRLPTRQAWIVTTVGHHAAGFASQLNHLLAQPDFAAFAAAAPQAGRLLRPLCRMLGIPTPPAIPRPKPPRKPRAPHPAPPPAEPPRHGKYLPSQMRRYRPGPIPKFILRTA